MVRARLRRDSALLGTGSHPIRAAGAEAALREGAGAREAAHLAAAEIEHPHRRALVALTREAIAAAAPREAPAAGPVRVALLINGVPMRATSSPAGPRSPTSSAARAHGHQGRLRGGRLRRVHRAARTASPVRSLPGMLAVQADGTIVRTIEGLADEDLHPLQAGRSTTSTRCSAASARPAS